MALQVPPNSTGQVIDTDTSVAGKERQVVTPPVGGQFNVVHTPAAAAQATITQAAGAAGVRNVCSGIAFSVQTIGTIQPPFQVNLRDGATGAGTILWSMTVGLAVSSFTTFAITGLNIRGTAATAMTLETSAAPAAAASASVSLQGYTTA